MESGTFLKSDNPKVPEAKFAFHHCLPVQMRFTDIDMLGHLNNNVYLSFMDLAKVNYFSDVLPEGMDWHSINAVVVHDSAKELFIKFPPMVQRYGKISGVLAFHMIQPEKAGSFLRDGHISSRDTGRLRLLDPFVNIHFFHTGPFKIDLCPRIYHFCAQGESIDVGNGAVNREEI